MGHGPDKIQTPRGCVFKTEHGTAQLEWNEGFAAQRNESFTRKQKFVDSEVLRLCSPRVPFRTGMLEKSGKLGTVIGSGEVDYVAPYAAPQYYNTAETRPYDANRGAKWFERMKVADGDTILKGAEKI